ncbi:MAG: acyltransferase [Pseudomonadota bacterium]
MGDAPTFNRRSSDWDSVPPPMAVTDEIISLCRQKVESPSKSQLRALYLKLVGWRFKAREIGEGFQWGRSAKIAGARIGRYVYVADGSDLSGPVTIGDLTMVSTNVRFVGADHIYSDAGRPMRVNFNIDQRPATVIEADCWIGHGATLLEGVRLARGTVIASGAVVTKSTLPYSIVRGVPASAFKSRFDDPSQCEQHDKLLYGQVRPIS